MTLHSFPSTHSFNRKLFHHTVLYAFWTSRMKANILSLSFYSALIHSVYRYHQHNYSLTWHLPDPHAILQPCKNCGLIIQTLWNTFPLNCIKVQNPSFIYSLTMPMIWMDIGYSWPYNSIPLSFLLLCGLAAFLGQLPIVPELKTLRGVAHVLCRISSSASYIDAGSECLMKGTWGLNNYGRIFGACASVVNIIHYEATKTPPC